MTIRAAAEPRAVYYHPISLREPLPAIKIPLRLGDEPVELELQPLLEQAYANGRYGRTLNYSQPLDPPLEGEDAQWAEDLLKAHRKH